MEWVIHWIPVVDYNMTVMWAHKVNSCLWFLIMHCHRRTGPTLFGGGGGGLRSFARILGSFRLTTVILGGKLVCACAWLNFSEKISHAHAHTDFPPKITVLLVCLPSSVESSLTPPARQRWKTRSAGGEGGGGGGGEGKLVHLFWQCEKRRKKILYDHNVISTPEDDIRVIHLASV